MAAVPVLVLGLSALSVAAGLGACDGDCVDTYDKCIGRDIFSLKYCCDPEDECVKFSKWYGQCRPKSDERFDDDWLGVAEDCRQCGVETKVVGTEFNFANDIYCELTFLGDFTLEECATQCQNGPYVACDRFNDAADITASCYGYSELFEGGCFTRVPNEFYDSWLTCPSGPVLVPEFSDDEPAALSVTTLAADIAADEAATETVDAVAQRERDMAGAASPARK